MKVRLPKASKGVVYSRLFTIEMNNYDAEELLPSLFFLVVTRGRKQVGSLKKVAIEDLRDYTQGMIDSEKLVGFDQADGQRLLERWLRTSVLRMSAKGRSRSAEQIEHLLPLTLLAYKAGLPRWQSRLRKVHVFLYETMLRELRTLGITQPAPAISALFSSALGQGVEIGLAPTYEGHYDGSTKVDINTFASLCFLDQVPAISASGKETGDSYPPTLATSSSAMGHELLGFIKAYKDRLPQLALTSGLIALINFELFVYTAKLADATNSLVDTGEIPPQMQDNSTVTGPQLYVDFTRERGSLSDDMARACVERDLESVQLFYDNVVLLKTLDRFAAGQAALGPHLKPCEDDPPVYFRTLLGLREEGAIEQRAHAEIDAIRAENETAAAENSDVAEYLERLRSDSSQTSLAKVVALLADYHRVNSLGAFMKWYWSVGGLRKPYGLVTGNLTGKRLGRYAISDDLLSSLVQLAFVQDVSGDLQSVKLRPRLALGEFLEWLESRFGVLVARPPDFQDGASNRAAAKLNLEALKRRLRQMGFFEDLSDDFTAQYLHNPFVAEVTK